MQVKERPIIFSGQEVRAILDRTKTQARRVIKNNARGADRVEYVRKSELYPGKPGKAYSGWVACVDNLNGLALPLSCPFGQPGERLYVKEAWAYTTDYCGQVLLDGREALYRADNDQSIIPDRWRSSIHMPREYSRLALEITDVRVERLQEISEQDAQAEGIANSTTPILTFMGLWDSTNKKHPWSSNPWCWVLTFKKTPPALEG